MARIDFMKVYHYTPMANLHGILGSGKLIPQPNPHFPEDLDSLGLPDDFIREGVSAMFSPKPDIWVNSPLGNAFDSLQFKLQTPILLEVESGGLNGFVLDAGYIAVYYAMHKRYGTRIGDYIERKYLIPEEDLEAGEEIVYRGQNERFVRSAVPIGEYDQETNRFLIPEIFIASNSPIPIEGRLGISAEQPMLESHIASFKNSMDRQAFLFGLGIFAEQIESMYGKRGLVNWYQDYAQGLQEKGFPNVSKER